MLDLPCEWANLRGRREGRVGSYRVSRVTTLDCTDGQFDTPLATLVAPNGYMGSGPADQDGKQDVGSKQQGSGLGKAQFWIRASAIKHHLKLCKGL